MHQFMIVDNKLVVIKQPEYEDRTWRDSVCDWIEMCYYKAKIQKTERHKKKLEKQVSKLLPKCAYKDYSQYDLPSVMRKEKSC
jgi:hypothetical protein